MPEIFPQRRLRARAERQPTASPPPKPCYARSEQSCERVCKAFHSVPVGMFVVAGGVGVAAGQSDENDHQQAFEGAIFAELQRLGEGGGLLRPPVDLAQEFIQVEVRRLTY